MRTRHIKTWVIYYNKLWIDCMMPELIHWLKQTCKRNDASRLKLGKFWYTGYKPSNFVSKPQCSWEDKLQKSWYWIRATIVFFMYYQGVIVIILCNYNKIMHVITKSQAKDSSERGQTLPSLCMHYQTRANKKIPQKVQVFWWNCPPIFLLSLWKHSCVVITDELI